MKAAALVVLCGCVAATTVEAAGKAAVRVVRDVAYLQGANYSDNTPSRASATQLALGSQIYSAT